MKNSDRIEVIGNLASSNDFYTLYNILYIKTTKVCAVLNNYIHTLYEIHENMFGNALKWFKIQVKMTPLKVILTIINKFQERFYIKKTFMQKLESYMDATYMHAMHI